MVTIGPYSAVLSPVISILMPALDKKKKKNSFFWKLKIFKLLFSPSLWRVFKPLSGFFFWYSASRLSLSVQSLLNPHSDHFFKASRDVQEKHFSRASDLNTLNVCHFFLISFNLISSWPLGNLHPGKWAAILLWWLLQFLKAFSQKDIILLSLSPHLNYIIFIWAADAADIPAVHQHRASLTLGPSWGGEGRRGRWGGAGCSSRRVLGQETGSSWAGSSSWARHPSWEHWAGVEARQRWTIRQREAWWEHPSHAWHVGAQHEWWQGSWKWTGSFDWWRGWWCWGGRWDGGSGGCHQWWGRRGSGNSAGSAHVPPMPIWVHVTGVTQLSVGGLEVMRACPHEKRMPQWTTQHARV